MHTLPFHPNGARLELGLRSAAISIALCLSFATSVIQAAPKNVPGVDLKNKTITLGALNDESGPAALASIPFALGKRLLVEQVNSGRSKMLPPGWRLKLEERDHQFNNELAMRQMNEIKDDVFMVATCYGTATVLAIRPYLSRHNIVAFPAALSSRIASFEYTPSLGVTNRHEAMSAMNWALEDAGTPTIRAGIIYQQDDYGLDGLQGWREAAAFQGFRIQTEHSYSAGQKDFTQAVKALQDDGVTHVLLTTIPSATRQILRAAEAMDFRPQWIGNTGSWSDKFFTSPSVPRTQVDNYALVTSMPIWGEDLPFMKGFLAAYREFGPKVGAFEPDSYLMLSYLQGAIALKILNMTITGGEITRENYLQNLSMLKNIDVFGKPGGAANDSEPSSKTGFKMRVFRPAASSWKVDKSYIQQ